MEQTLDTVELEKMYLLVDTLALLVFMFSMTGARAQQFAYYQHYPIINKPRMCINEIQLLCEVAAVQPAGVSET